MKTLTAMIVVSGELFLGLFLMALLVILALYPFGAMHYLANEGVTSITEHLLVYGGTAIWVFFMIYSIAEEER